MDSLTDPPHTACSATTSAPHPEALPSLAGLSREAIKDHIGNLGIPAKQLAMRTQQVWNWIYHHGVDDFAAMANVSKAIKQALAQNFTLERPEIIEDACSKDGTRKWLLRFALGAEAETVFIPGVARSTALCVSSQVGCTLNCRFCYTGTQKLVRNLSAQEIVSQLLIARDRLQTWPSGQATNTPSNIVFMGMGEPLYNLDSVLEAIETLTDSAGLCTGQRHITVSTAGIAPQIPELGARSNALLAISLHATHDDLRNQLVPINRKYDLKTLFEAIKAYPGLSNARRVTFEYVMLDQVNDSDAEARDLLRLIAGIPAKINLIPFNPWPGSPYKCSKPERIRAFADIIWRGGYASPVRTPRGRDIMAACGQLRSASEKARRSKTSILPQIAHGDS